MSRPEGERDQEHTPSTDKDKNEDPSRTGRSDDVDECGVENRGEGPGSNRAEGPNPTRGGDPWPDPDAELAGDGFTDPD